jgi:D-alanyl-lipoteichoic acid acyltransferase DltB (MBOAT superfamily)
MKKEKYLSIAANKWIYLIAIMITFAVCGIWHGVGWTYLLWGIIFGTYLTYSNWMREFHKAFRKRFKINKTSKHYIFYKVITTFFLVMFAWIFFRAESVNDALSIIKRIFTSRGPVFYENPSNLIFAIIGILILVAVDFKQEYFLKKWLIFHSKHQLIRIAGIIIIVLAILLIGVFDGGQFIYFQF